MEKRPRKYRPEGVEPRYRPEGVELNYSPEDQKELKLKVDANVHSEFKAEAAKNRMTMINFFLKLFGKYKEDNEKKQ